MPAPRPERRLPVLVLSGATATGKSALAVRVAQQLTAAGRPAEIVNADASLVYRGMDIGTAKPSLAERGGIAHHLIDFLDVTEEASVADFQRLARAAVADCRERGVVPVVVGGSALYLRAVVDEFEFPGTDPVVRAGYEARLASEGPQPLYAELQARAPEAAAGILPTNGRRIVRALEVIALTGSFRSALPAYTYALHDVVQVGLELPRDVLDRRIADRVDAMWAAGLVDEVRQLEAQGLRHGRTAAAALGYRQVLAFLAGDCTEAEARADTVRGTRRFARKQDGWFRRDPRIRRLSAADPDAVEQVLIALDAPVG